MSKTPAELRQELIEYVKSQIDFTTLIPGLTKAYISIPNLEYIERKVTPTWNSELGVTVYFIYDGDSFRVGEAFHPPEGLICFGKFNGVNLRIMATSVPLESNLHSQTHQENVLIWSNDNNNKFSFDYYGWGVFVNKTYKILNNSQLLLKSKTGSEYSVEFKSYLGNIGGDFYYTTSEGSNKRLSTQSSFWSEIESIEILSSETFSLGDTYGFLTNGRFAVYSEKQDKLIYLDPAFIRLAARMSRE